MLGTTAETSNAVHTADQSGFANDVLAASETRPVLIYFTAAWCGPCKTMGPALEKAVNAQKGRIVCYRYNIDNNRELAAQLGIKSIPAVFAFFAGRPVDGFMGAKTEGDITDFIRSVLARTLGEDDSDPLEAAEELLENGAMMDAMQIFGTYLTSHPEDERAYAGMIRCRLQLDDLEMAEALLNAVPDSIKDSTPIMKARASIDLARQVRSAGPVDDLRAALDREPENHQCRFDLAIALHAGGETDTAVDELLELYRRDSEWNEGAARDQLLRIFDSLAPNSPSVLRGRRRLSSLVFA